MNVKRPIDLFNDNVTAKPHDFAFHSRRDWRIILPDLSALGIGRLQEIYSDGYDVPLRVDYANSAEYRDALRDGLQERFIHDQTFHPQMNYIYPLGELRNRTPELAQTALIGAGAVVVVGINTDEDDDEGETVLALSGGGMDLSWDICRAYILLGFYPPVHFTDLPRFAGREFDPVIAQACIESAEMASQWATRKADDLRARLAEFKGADSND